MTPKGSYSSSNGAETAAIPEINEVASNMLTRSPVHRIDPIVTIWVHVFVRKPRHESPEIDLSRQPIGRCYELWQHGGRISERSNKQWFRMNSKSLCVD